MIGRPLARSPLRRLGGDRGSVAAELTLVTPLLLVVLLFVVLCGRLVGARLRLEDVAHQAARAASAARTIPAAQADARATAEAALTAAGIACRALQVTVDTAGLRPGSTVTATVACTVGLGDMSLLSVPGTTRLSATFTSPVDEFREAPGGQG
jgi:Flp pilus assembly protein TadG